MPQTHQENATAYWKENIRLMLILLAVWFIASFGMGILFADELDHFRIAGFKFGFWMAQQGSIYVFVLLIFVYVYKMNKLDHKYGVDEDDDNYVADDDYYHPDDSVIDSISQHENKGDNRLTDAVIWLNNELKRTPYMKETLSVDERKINIKVADQMAVVKNIEATLKKRGEQVEGVKRKETIYNKALKIKLRIENYLEDIASEYNSDIEKEIKNLQININGLMSKLRDYDVDSKLIKSEKYVAKVMNEIGANLDFEESYKPINLQFNFSSFDLWNINKDDKKVFLRSMGSGANWLYCHLVLFMALHKLFCSRGESCNIPPVMFFDQPTQVYFPNTTRDDSDEFKADGMIALDRIKKVDEDIKSVERFFNEIIKYCDKTEEDTGIKPQIIITDHADNLNLENDNNFEDYVRARWRTRGFIEQ